MRRRFEWNWSATQAFEAVRESLGLAAKSRTAYLPFEYNREPDEAEAAIFERIFKGRPDERDRATPPPPVIGQDALVKALSDHTDAIKALIARWDALASSAIREGVAEALREAAALQDDGASQSGPPPGPPT